MMKTKEKIKKIGYLGPDQSFTYISALKRFGTAYHYMPQLKIYKIFQDIVNDNIDIAVVPVENSTGGHVYDTVDELVNDNFSTSGVKIQEELSLRIVLNLMSKYKLPKIQKIFSHLYPIRSCREWLEENMPTVQITEVNSTSEAAILASKEKNSAAIASREAAKTYGLNLIAQDIGDKGKPNITRFLVLSKLPIIHRPSSKAKKKTAVVFSLLHKAGALHAALGVLAKGNINLTRIISRPVPKTRDEYKFFVELDGSIDNLSVKKALATLKRKTTDMNVISSYTSLELK